MTAPPPELVEALAQRMNGSWILDHARSDPMEPLLTALGIPWLVQQVIRLTTPTWDIILDQTGFTHAVKGSLLSNRTNVYTFAGPNEHVAGDGSSNPATITIADDGSKLLLVVHDAARGELTTVFTPSTATEPVSLTGVITLVAKNGATVAVKRVFVRHGAAT